MPTTAVVGQRVTIEVAYTNPDGSIDTQLNGTVIWLYNYQTDQLMKARTVNGIATFTVTFTALGPAYIAANASLAGIADTPSVWTTVDSNSET